MNEKAKAGILDSVKGTLPSLFLNRGISAEIVSRTPSGAASADLWMRLTVDDRSVEVAVCARSRVTEQVISRAGELAHNSIATLIVVPHIRPEVQERLKSLNVNFADLTGTISLQAPGIRIDVRGNLPVPDNAHGNAKQQVNPFSKKASAVLRVLCEQYPKALSLSLLSKQTQLSGGWVSSVVRELITRDYAADDGDGVMLSNSVTMLRDWITEYKWSKNAERQYVVPFDGAEIMQQIKENFANRQVRWATTLVAGAQLRVEGLSHNSSFHVYADAADHNIANALADLYAQPVRDGGNLILFAPPYYGPSVFIGAQKSKGTNVVSDVQLLLDLARYPMRGAELAESLIRSRIADQFELTSEETKLLSERVS